MTGQLSASSAAGRPGAFAARISSRLGARPIPGEAIVLITLSGSLLINMTGQSVNASLTDIVGAVGLSVGEGSWLTTSYNMGLLIGISLATPLVGTFGVSRCFTAAAFLFAFAGAACAHAAGLAPMAVLRGLQGLAAGMFSPVAFVAVFMTMRGPRLPLGLTFLAITLLLPSFWAPVVSAYVEDRLGWQALFHLQVGAGAALAALGTIGLARAPIVWTALQRDWTAIALMALASGATMLVFGQGRRLYWLDSSLIIWGIAVAAGAWAGLFVTLARSAAPVLNTKLVLSRGFMVPIGLNLLFRIGFATGAFLIPQFLIVVQDYRPLEIARVFLWPGITHLFMFPIAYLLMKRVDGRWIAGAGLAICGGAALFLADQTALASGGDFRLALAAAAAGQVLFLVPNLIAGARVLAPQDGPTATLMFNGTTVGGNVLGVALASEVLTHRQKLHTALLAESSVTFGPPPSRADPLAQYTPSGNSGDDPQGADPVALIAERLGLQSTTMSFNDAYLLGGTLLLAATPAVLLLGRQPPLGHRDPAGENQ